MVDRIELIVVHQADDMGKLQGDHAARSQKDPQALDKVMDARYLGKHVVADDKVGPLPLPGKAVSELRSEELDESRDALCLGLSGHVGRGFDAKRDDAVRKEILKEVAVVAGNLNHVGASSEVQLSHQAVHVAFGVVEPTG